MFLTMVGIASSIIVLPVNILNILNSYETLPVLSDFKILVCWALLQTVMVFGISLGTSVAFPLFIAIGLNLSHPFSIAIQFIQNNVSLLVESSSLHSYPGECDAWPRNGIETSRFTWIRL